MEEKIQEVEKYFRNKLVLGEYEVGERTDTSWELIVDKKYSFYVWIANGGFSYGINDIGNHSYMHFKFTEEEKIQSWSLIKEQISQYHKEVILAKKRQQYEDLKKELDIE